MIITSSDQLCRCPKDSFEKVIYVCQKMLEKYHLLPVNEIIDQRIPAKQKSFLIFMIWHSQNRLPSKNGI